MAPRPEDAAAPSPPPQRVRAARPPTPGRFLARRGPAVRALTSAVALTGLLGMVTSCGGATGAGGQGSQGGLDRQVTLAVAPVINAAPLYIAQQKGLFAKEGIKVTLKPVTNVAAAFPAMATGDTDMVYSSLSPFLIAVGNGQDMKLVTEVSRGAPKTVGIVSKNPAIRTPKDLEGKKIATPTMTGCNLIAGPTLESAGVDPKKIHWVELLYANQGPALDQGSIDAACTVEPFITTLGTQLGTHLVLDALTGPNQKVALDGVYAMSSYAKAHAKTVTALRDAIAEASAMANEDPALVRSVAKSVARTPADVAARIALPSFVTKNDPALLAQPVDRLVKAGAIPRRIAPAGLLAR
ncbi:NrtA/SsuA/CpmA family ABC transporter substrate-binding protein [Streptomyces sp. NPDC048278]|uniref:ABC transporter substrate-binding protein n=1 Tax=Streptomyces sp. NPDC048278 TaxID=3155809 RepID=UPI0034293B69